MSDEIVDHDDKVMLTKESYKSMSVSVNESTNINNSTPSLFLQCLYKQQGLSLQYLHKAIITILCLHCLYENTSNVVHLLSSVRVPTQISIREDILHHLYKRISTVILVLVFLRISLLDKFIQPSLFMSLRSGMLQLSLLMSLRSGILQSSTDTSTK